MPRKDEGIHVSPEMMVTILILSLFPLILVSMAEDFLAAGYGRRVWEEGMGRGYGKRIWEEDMGGGYGRRVWEEDTFPLSKKKPSGRFRISG